MASDIFFSSMPIILLMALGFLLRRLGLFDKKDGNKLTLIVFYVTLPATLFLALSKAVLSPDMIYLPISAAAIILTTIFISIWISKVMNFSNAVKGTFVSTTSIINMSLFAYPFLYIAYGSEGLAKGAMFDLANGIIIFTLIYYLASKYGNGKTSNPAATLKKFALTPPLWGIIGGLAFNVLGIGIPGIATSFLGLLDAATVPLIMLSLGLFIEGIKSDGRIVALAAFTRMGLGLMLGFTVSYILGLEGMTRSVVILSSMMPAGMNSLIFAVKEGLDKELAAAVISVTIVLGLILVPVMISLM